MSYLHNIFDDECYLNKFSCGVMDLRILDKPSLNAHICSHACLQSPHSPICTHTLYALRQLTGRKCSNSMHPFLIGSVPKAIQSFLHSCLSLFILSTPVFEREGKRAWPPLDRNERTGRTKANRSCQHTCSVNLINNYVCVRRFVVHVT